MKNVLKYIGKYILLALTSIVLGIFIMPDRIIQAFIPWRDIPGWNEITTFEHEKEALTRRFTIYILIFAFISCFWWIPFMYNLIASFF